MDQHQDGDATFGDEAEVFLLKYKSHNSHFANKFSELLDEDDMLLADVTLCCEGSFLQAHRLVLSVCSPFFKNLFKVNCADKGPATIVLANVRYTDLENILHFIYRGQVNVKKEDLNSFLETGEQLQIDGLVGQGQQSKQNSTFKRRYSEGGPALGRAGSHASGQNVGNANKNSRGLSQAHQQSPYKTVTGNRTSSSSVSQNNHSNHLDHTNPAKKSRISPPINTGSTVKAEPAATATTRRSSTSNSVVLYNTNPTPSSPGNPEEVDHENNGIKILAVASMNSAASNAVYDGQGNDIFEILDCEEDDRVDNEYYDPELFNAYGEDGQLYSYQNSTYGRSSLQGLGQQSRVTARYPSIIDGVHFDLISADEKRVAAQCKLCPGEKVIRGSGLTSSNFISHLRAFHKPELEEWREKRKSETKRRMDLHV